MIYLIFIPLSFLLSCLLVYLIKNQLSAHLIDIPNERSSHTQPTPRGGGLGFVASFFIVSWCFSWLFTPNTVSTAHLNVSHIWLVLLPLTVVGLLDDRWQIPARLRYLVQIVAASIAISFFGIFPQPWLTNLGPVGITIAILLTLVGMTALINFYNFMDGLDGLVGGVTMIQLSWIALMGNQPLWVLLIAALAGFLYWNWSPAKIFMGDVGSTVLGATVAIALFNYSHHGSVVQAWSALTITLPITGDAIYTLICRLKRRENIFKAHRTHLYQRLHQAGWNHSQVAISYMIFTSAIGLNIYLFASLGAWINLLMTAAAIAFLEMYLKQLTTYSREKVLTKDVKNDK